jgi:hypothetical protein
MRIADGKLHFSDLKHIGDTPKRFEHNLAHPAKDTASFRKGRAVHSKWLLGIDPPVWEGRRDLRNKEYAAAVEAHGEGLLNDAEYSDVLNMVRALDLHDKACWVKSRCLKFEVPMTWTRNSIECAGTLDACGRDVLMELKSCESRKIRPASFQRAGMWLRYPEQCAWYAVGRFESTQINDTRPRRQWPETYCITVESSAPYDVVVHRLSPLLLDRADENVERWLTIYKACKAAGNWPGHADDIVDWDASVEWGPADED